MSLQNLVGKSLEQIDPDRRTIDRLVQAAQRNLKDAQVTEISTENRFDAAYKAVMQLANAALQAKGYRTLTSVPGHHATMIQLLTQTAGLSKQQMILLDALRKQRNVADYSGDLVPSSAVEECVARAQQLLSTVQKQLAN